MFICDALSSLCHGILNDDITIEQVKDERPIFMKFAAIGPISHVYVGNHVHEYETYSSPRILHCFFNIYKNKYNHNEDAIKRKLEPVLQWYLDTKPPVMVTHARCVCPTEGFKAIWRRCCDIYTVNGWLRQIKSNLVIDGTLTTLPTLNILNPSPYAIRWISNNELIPLHMPIIADLENAVNLSDYDKTQKVILFPCDYAVWYAIGLWAKQDYYMFSSYILGVPVVRHPKLAVESLCVKLNDLSVPDYIKQLLR